MLSQRQIVVRLAEIDTGLAVRKVPARFTNDGFCQHGAASIPLMHLIWSQHSDSALVLIITTLNIMKKLDPVFRSALDRAYTHAISHLEHLDETSVAATSDVETLRTRIAKQLPVEGIPADEVIEELVRNVDGGLIGSAGGRFFGWVIGGVLPAAMAADWLTSAWQQNGCLYATSPAAAIVEETVGEWLKEIFRLPSNASF